MEDTDDKDRVSRHAIKHAMLTVAPASETRAAVFVDLTCAGIFTQRIEGLEQAKIICVARFPTMNGSAVKDEVEKISIGLGADFKPLYAPSE